MLVCYARELKEGFASYSEDVVKIMVAHLKFYFHDGMFCVISLQVTDELLNVNSHTSAVASYIWKYNSTS